MGCLILLAQVPRALAGPPPDGQGDPESGLARSAVEATPARGFASRARPRELRVDARARELVIPFGMVNLTALRDGAGLARFPGLPVAGEPGQPALPAQVVRILIPADADARTVNVSIRDPVVAGLGDGWEVAPAPPYGLSGGEVVWPSGRTIRNGRDLGVYGADAFHPSRHRGRFRVERLGRWQVLFLIVCPYRYNPVTGSLVRLDGGELVVAFESRAAGGVPPPRGGPATARELERFLPGLLNVEAAAPGYAEPAGGEDLPPPAPSATADYVIITTSSIASQATRLADFVAAKTALGFAVQVVTEAAAADDSHYLSGTSCNQRADNIRAWLASRYAGMGIDYVLLIGNPHPTTFSSSSSVPMKMCYPRNADPDHKESPTDMYFAELTGNWDNDGDGVYGEYEDVDAGGIDMLCEVAVGRIPVYDTGSTQIGHLDSILNKTIVYETSTSRRWRYRTLGSASFQDDAFVVDGAEMIEHFRGNVCSDTLRLYQQGSRHASCDSVYDSDYELRGAAYGTDVNHHHYHWQNNDYGVVIWWGHGSQTSTQVGPNVAPDGTLYSSSYATSLDNGHPSFLFPSSCNNGYPENANNLCVAVLRNGGIGSLSPSRVTWYAVDTWQPTFLESYSDNASYNGFTAERLVAEREPLGDAVNWVHANGGIDTWKGSSLMNHFDFNIYGDPSVGLFTASVDPPDVTTDGAVSNITPHTAMTGGTVTGEGGGTVTARGVCWATHGKPNVNDSSMTNGTGSGHFACTITGLTASATYYVRAFAENAAGLVYGDDVVFATAITLPYTNSFEGGIGSGWLPSAGNVFDWTRNSGETPSSKTGPSGAGDGTWYIYTEASSPNYPYKTAALEATCDFSGCGSPVMRFLYHMYGSTMGSVSIDVYDGTWQQNVWTRSGQQHNRSDAAWSAASVDLAPYAYTSGVRIRLRGVTGSSYTGDAAVDRIIITNAPLAGTPLTVTSPYGMAQPPVGVHILPAGTNLACRVTNSPAVFADAQSVVTCICTGWTGTGSVPASGSGTNTGSFALHEASSIVWHWVVTDIVLSNQTVTGSLHTQALYSVTARDGYHVAPGGNVRFEAGQSVRLEPGFTARSGSVFRAVIDPGP